MKTQNHIVTNATEQTKVIMTILSLMKMDEEILSTQGFEVNSFETIDDELDQFNDLKNQIISITKSNLTNQNSKTSTIYVVTLISDEENPSYCSFYNMVFQETENGELEDITNSDIIYFN